MSLVWVLYPARNRRVLGLTSEWQCRAGGPLVPSHLIDHAGFVMAIHPKDSNERPDLEKSRLQFTLAELLGWITGVAVWLSLLKWSGSWPLAITVGVWALAFYCERRFALRFPDKHLPITILVVVAICIVAGVILALILPALR